MIRSGRDCGIFLMTDQTTKEQELPELTPQRHKFVECLLQDKTASDAYRIAFNCENMSDNALRVEASRLKRDPNVALWLKAAKEHSLIQRVYGLQEHLRDLEEAKQLAKDTGNVGAYVKATELLGRASGVYVERIQTDASEKDIVAILEKMGQPGRELAKNLGIDLPNSDTTVHQHQTKH